MKNLTPKSGSLPELAGVVAAAILCGIALIAHAQTTTPALPPTTLDATGKPRIAPEPPKVLADPDTKMYSVCTTGTEHEDSESSGSEYKRPPRSVVITEEDAKKRGYRAGAHKVSCK